MLRIHFPLRHCSNAYSSMPSNVWLSTPAAPLLARHRAIGMGQYVFPVHLVIQRMEPLRGRILRFGMQCRLQFLNTVWGCSAPKPGRRVADQQVERSGCQCGGLSIEIFSPDHHRDCLDYRLNCYRLERLPCRAGNQKSVMNNE